MAPRLPALAAVGLDAAAARSGAGRHLHRPGHAADRHSRRTGTASSPTAGCSATPGRCVSGSNPTGCSRPSRSTRPPAAEPEARGRTFRCAKLFWWFNQGAAVDISVTPKPYYGADGNKAFGIHGTPLGLTDRLEAAARPVSLLRRFWGPMAGLPCTQWIARCAAEIVANERPDLTLVYLPHLDYDPQRFGPASCDMKRLVGELDDACVPLLDAARAGGARVWVVSEYGHVPVNRAGVDSTGPCARRALLAVRPGPFGEMLDLFESRAFAVCDHQLAHVYVPDPDDHARACASLLQGWTALPASWPARSARRCTWTTSAAAS